MKWIILTSQIRSFFILIWILLSVGFCKEEDIVKIQNDKESGSQIALRNFTRVQYKSGGTMEWKLIAKESYVFPEEDRTVFYEMKFLQYDGGKVTSELVSDWGEVNHTTKKLELKGNIFLTTPDKRSLKTEYLNYDLESEELTTDEDVSIYSSGTFIQGKGLRAKRDLGEYTIIRPIAITRGGKNPFQKD